MLKPDLAGWQANKGVPGVSKTTAAGVGPTLIWKQRAGRLIGVMWNPKAQKDFAPFLKEAEVWLDEACAQLALAGDGVCGAIEANALSTAAWQTAYARYWMWLATSSPHDMKLFETASKVADAARQNSLAAYEIAVRHARMKIKTHERDPLAMYDKAPDHPLPKDVAQAITDNPTDFSLVSPDKHAAPGAIPFDVWTKPRT